LKSLGIRHSQARAVAQALRNAIALGDFDKVFPKQEAEALVDEKPVLSTVEAYYNDVFKPVYIESALATSTAASYMNNFKNHITPALGSLRLDEVTHERMEEFISSLVKKGLAFATIQTIIKDLTTFFNHSRKRKLITDNPASGLSQLYSQANQSMQKLSR